MRFSGFSVLEKASPPPFQKAKKSACPSFSKIKESVCSPFSNCEKNPCPLLFRYQKQFLHPYSNSKKVCVSAFQISKKVLASTIHHKPIHHNQKSMHSTPPPRTIKIKSSSPLHHNLKMSVPLTS